uniref:Uncharacterized protein n=1 Tax=Oryza glumipatula TaxID=40148 RepID=A0A0D9ZYP6_9ORYZ
MASARCGQTMAPSHLKSVYYGIHLTVSKTWEFNKAEYWKALCRSEETLLMETTAEKLKVTTTTLGAQRTGVG